MTAETTVLRSLFDLRGKTALVTGGFSGLGWHFAQVLVQAGARVVVAGRRIERGRAMVAGCTAEREAALHAVAVDVASEQSVADLVGETQRWGGGLDIVVNNAGVADTHPSLELDEAQWRAVMDVNLDGAWRVAQHGARAMAAQPTPGGSLINVGSILGLRVAAQVLAYAVSKAAVLQLTRALALEWARHGIRVNALAPGYFETELNQGFVESDAGAALVRRVPMRRLGRLDELSGPLLLLASGAGSFMTGSVLVVDGGHTQSTL